MDTLTLSDAILKGATLRPQGRAAYFSPNEFDIVASCALGAAFEAVTGRREHLFDTTIIGTLEEHWPSLDQDIVHPISHFHRPLWDVITDLNDLAGWSREQIAAWLKEKDL